jgi:SMC interacting uncharacterized protein involved in chromosome segregation
LQERYHTLNTRKIQAETQRDNAKERLDELNAEAVEKYGTADVEQLKKKLEQMKTENEQKRSKYQADLDKIEQDLAAVETKFGEAELPSEEDEERT